MRFDIEQVIIDNDLKGSSNVRVLSLHQVMDCVGGGGTLTKSEKFKLECSKSPVSQNEHYLLATANRVATTRRQTNEVVCLMPLLVLTIGVFLGQTELLVKKWI